MYVCVWVFFSGGLCLLWLFFFIDNAFAYGATGRRINPYGGHTERFLVPAMLHDCCNKGRGMYHPALSPQLCVGLTNR